MSEEVAIAPGESLPFDEKRQDALLGHMLFNESFFLQAHSKIKPEWFLDPWTAKVWKATLLFFAAHGRPPKEHELRGGFEFMKEDAGARQRMNAKITIAKTQAHEYGLDVIRAELTTWLKTRVYKAYAEKTNDLYNAASKVDRPDLKFQEAFAKWKEGVVLLEQTSFEVENIVDFADVSTGAFFSKKEDEYQNALTFGNVWIDKKLNPQAPYGSLLRGDHTTLLAPTNVGKTTTMITVAAMNIVRGKRVLFITHEGRPDDIKTKILMAVTRRTYPELLEMSKTIAGLAQLDAAAKLLSQFLVYIPLNKAGITVEEVMSVMRRQQDRMKAITGGAGFDLIVNDYPAKLRLESAGKGWAKRQIDEDIYNCFTQIGLEFNCHVLDAIQTNREGSKINMGRKGAEDRLITLEDVAESFGVMATATNVISLNRDPAAAAKKRMTFHICKSRSNDTGWSIVSKTSYERSLTHASMENFYHLPSTFYRGMSPLSEKIDDLLEQYADAAIPEQYYYK